MGVTNRGFDIASVSVNGNMVYFLITGEGCSEKLKLDCNLPASPEYPYGSWIVSICVAHCDTTRAMCFCGEGTKYPNRPTAEACGFQTM